MSSNPHFHDYLQRVAKPEGREHERAAYTLLHAGRLTGWTVDDAIKFMTDPLRYPRSRTLYINGLTRLIEDFISEQAVARGG